jgi:hypothetical protein
MRRDDYFAELVERLTAVTPDIDHLIAVCLRRKPAKLPARPIDKKTPVAQAS